MKSRFAWALRAMRPLAERLAPVEDFGTEEDFGLETLAFVDLDCVTVFAEWVPLPGSPSVIRVKTKIRGRNQTRRYRTNISRLLIPRPQGIEEFFIVLKQVPNW